MWLRYGAGFWTWRRARRDARMDHPGEHPKALGDTEREIQTAINGAINRAKEEYGTRRERFEGELFKLERIGEELRREWNRLTERAERYDVQICLSKMLYWLIIAGIGLG